MKLYSQKSVFDAQNFITKIVLLIYRRRQPILVTTETEIDDPEIAQDEISDLQSTYVKNLERAHAEMNRYIYNYESNTPGSRTFYNRRKYWHCLIIKLIIKIDNVSTKMDVRDDKKWQFRSWWTSIILSRRLKLRYDWSYGIASWVKNHPPHNTIEWYQKRVESDENDIELISWTVQRNKWSQRWIMKLCQPTTYVKILVNKTYK